MDRKRRSTASRNIKTFTSYRKRNDQRLDRYGKGNYRIINVDGDDNDDN